MELAEHHGDRDRRRTRRGAEDEVPLDRSVAGGRDLRDELVLEREHALRAAVQAPPGLGGLDPPAGAIEELRPEPFLERANLQRDRGLRDSEPVRSL